MVEPGCWVSFSRSGRITRDTYYEFPKECSPSLGPAEADEAIVDVLDRAVRRHLVCDVPVGCFLSGGVDSPLIASVFRRVDARPIIPAFTIGSTDAGIDESESAHRHATSIGLQLHSKQMTDREAECLLDDVMAASTEPQADEGMFPSLMVSQLAAERVKVALSGEGADELFWGYVQRQCPFLSSPEAKDGRVSWKDYSPWFTEFRPEEFEACFPDISWFPTGHPLFDPDSLDSHHPAYSVRRYEMRTYLPFILLKTDRASMYHSLEVRLPFLDREVIEVASRVRWESCLDLNATVGKCSLRRILQNRGIRPSLHKRGFTAPMDGWLRGRLKQRIVECLDGLDEVGGVRFDQKAIEKLWSLHQQGVVQRGIAFWRIFVLCEWLRRNLT